MSTPTSAKRIHIIYHKRISIVCPADGRVIRCKTDKLHSTIAADAKRKVDWIYETRDLNGNVIAKRFTYVPVTVYKRKRTRKPEVTETVARRKAR